MENKTVLSPTDVFLTLKVAACSLQLVMEGIDRDLGVVAKESAASSFFADRFHDVYEPILADLYGTMSTVSKNAEDAIE